MKKQFISVLCVFMLIVSAVSPMAVMGAEEADVLALSRVIHSDGNFVFDVAIDSEALSYESARLAVAMYDDEGSLIEMQNETVTSLERHKEISLKAVDTIDSYRLMLLNSENLAVPLCKSVKEYIEVDDIPTDDTEYLDTVKLLTALDVINVSGLENANPLRKITRAEFAAVLCRVMNLEDEADMFREDNLFADVSAGYWASGCINLLAQDGIMADRDDGTFCPEDVMDYTEAIQAVVRMLGFEPLAQSAGGYPLDYIEIAKSYGITDGITTVSDVNAKTLALLMKNALHSPVMEPVGFGDDAEWMVMNGKGGTDFVSPLTKMDIYIATGIVGAKDYDEIAFTITEESEDLEFAAGNRMNFRINNSDILDYQYRNVNAYVKKSGREYKILAVTSTGIGETLIINSDDIKSISTWENSYYEEGTVEYYTDPENSSKAASFRVSISMIELNKKCWDEGLVSLCQNGDIELKFIENTGDNKYDAVVATQYIYDIIQSSDASLGKLVLENNGAVTLDFEDAAATIIMTDSAGRELTAEGFEAGDVVAIATDGAEPGSYNSYIKLVNLKDATVNDTIEEVRMSNGVLYIGTLGGDSYINATGEQLELGAGYTLYIGMTGKIVYAVYHGSGSSSGGSSGGAGTLPSDPVVPLDPSEVKFSGDSGLAIATKLSATRGPEGESLVNVNYVMNETEGEAVFGDYSVSKNNRLTYSDISVGDVFMFIEDEYGRVLGYIIIAQISDTSEGHVIALTEDVDTAEESAIVLGEDTELVLGYIWNEQKSTSNKGEYITIGLPDTTVVVRTATYKYTYNDLGRTTSIDVFDFMSEVDYAEAERDIYGYETGNMLVSPLFVRIVDDMVMDAYSTTARLSKRAE